MSSQLTWRCPACRVRAVIPRTATSVSCFCGYEQMGGIEPGLGDWIAAGLHRVGITRARYVRVKRWAGLQPSCRCPARQAWLNRFGRQLRAWLAPWSLDV